MMWATRPGIHVDRAASAWLITTYIDPGAEFVYVDDVADLPADVTPFDMVGVELTHHGEDVTFETILRRYDLTDPVLERLAEIVHQADVEDDRFDAPEAAGLDAIIRGLTLVHDDESVRHVTNQLFDGLYRYLTREAIGRI
jgi:hypothetical protein